MGKHMDNSIGESSDFWYDDPGPETKDGRISYEDAEQALRDAMLNNCRDTVVFLLEQHVDVLEAGHPEGHEPHWEEFAQVAHEVMKANEITMMELRFSHDIRQIAHKHGMGPHAHRPVWWKGKR